MNLDSIILQLKALAPLFAGNVAGAAKFAEATDEQTWLPQPAAYVVPVEEVVGPNLLQNGVIQNVTERFEVIVCLDNKADRRGQTAVTTLDDCKAAIFRSILNWRPDSTVDAPLYQTGNPFPDRSSRGLRYAGGEIREMDRSRLFWAFIFEIEMLISPADGWQIPSVPLLEIQGNPPEGNFGNFDVKLPQ